MSVTAVTGATGYLGSKVVAELARRGAQVLCLTRDVTALSSEKSIEALAEAFSKARVRSVAHLATFFVPEHSPEQIPKLIQSNIELGTRVAEAAVLAGVPSFLNIGTFWQHYEGKPYSPVSLYAATKQAMEDILRYYCEVRGLAVTTLKFAAVYGPDDPRRKIVNLLTEALKSGTPLAMSPGEQLIDLIHVEDAVQAVLRGLEWAEKSGKRGEYRAYSVTSGNPIPLKQLVEIMESISGKKMNIAWGGKPYRPREFFEDWVYDPPLPGWKPEKQLREGLAEIL